MDKRRQFTCLCIKSYMNDLNWIYLLKITFNSSFTLLKLVLKTKFTNQNNIFFLFDLSRLWFGEERKGEGLGALGEASSIIIVLYLLRSNLFMRQRAPNKVQGAEVVTGSKHFRLGKLKFQSFGSFQFAIIWEF